MISCELDNFLHPTCVCGETDTILVQEVAKRRLEYVHVREGYRGVYFSPIKNY